MEDFTTFCKTEKHNKAIEIQSSTNKQTGFIASRLNRDNFWNLVFAFLLFLGWVLGRAISQPLGVIILILIVIGAVVLVKKRSPLAFDKEKIEFTTGQGIKIRKSGIGLIWLILISSFSATLAAGLLTGATNINGSLLRQFLTLLFLAVFPSLYCIIRNFPISVYFHKNAWYVEGANTYSSNDSVGRSHNSFSRDISQINSPYNRRHNPINNYSATNSHYRK